MQFFDTHAHLFLLKEEPKIIIQRAKLAGITQIINVGFSLKTSIKAGETAQQFSNVFASIGIHPNEEIEINDLEKFPELLKKFQYRAIGEIGLDYFRDHQPKEKQQLLFIRQLEIAREFNLPVIIHNRDADEDIFEIIKNFSDLKKVFHCYSSSVEFTKKILSENHFFSFTGNVTYKNKEKILANIEFLPLEKIMIETDCPYITPMVFKGQDNEPAFVVEVAKKIAEIKSCPLEVVANITTENAKNFF